MLFVFRQFPMSPSENQMYPTIRDRRTGGLRRIASRELNAFKRQTESWRMQNLKMVKEAQLALSTEIRQNQMSMIRVDSYLGFQHSKLFTKQGMRKRMDASNRIKGLHDAISNILCIDDRFFYPGRTEPVIVDRSEDECALIVMQISQLREMNQANQTLSLGA